MAASMSTYTLRLRLPGHNLFSAAYQQCGCACAALVPLGGVAILPPTAGPSGGAPAGKDFYDPQHLLARTAVLELCIATPSSHSPSCHGASALSGSARDRARRTGRSHAGGRGEEGSPA